MRRESPEYRLAGHPAKKNHLRGGGQGSDGLHSDIKKEQAGTATMPPNSRMESRETAEPTGQERGLRNIQGVKKLFSEAVRTELPRTRDRQTFQLRQHLDSQWV